MSKEFTPKRSRHSKQKVTVTIDARLWKRAQEVGRRHYEGSASKAIEGGILYEWMVETTKQKTGKPHDHWVSAPIVLRPGELEPILEKILEPDDESIGTIIYLAHGYLEKTRTGWTYVNNRLEGCAPLTLARALARLPKRQLIIEVAPDADEPGKWRTRAMEDKGLSYLFATEDEAIRSALSEAESRRAVVHLLNAAGALRRTLYPTASNMPLRDGEMF